MHGVRQARVVDPRDGSEHAAYIAVWTQRVAVRANDILERSSLAGIIVVEGEERTLRDSWKGFEMACEIFFDAVGGGDHVCCHEGAFA